MRRSRSCSGCPEPAFYSYLDIALRRAELREAAVAAGVAHATSGAFSRTDELLLRLSQSLSAWQGNFVGLPLAVIPVGGFGDVRWLSPWQALAGQQTAALGAEQRRALESELLALRDLQVAYLEGRDLRFALATRQFTDSVRRRTADELEVKNPALEILFNRTNPYLAARIAYGGGLLLLALSFLGFKKWLYRASLLLLVLGLVPHTFGLVLRILITDRPPVTNLFETFVFVGWGAAVCGIAMEYLRKHYLGLFSGLAGGFVFLPAVGQVRRRGHDAGAAGGAGHQLLAVHPRHGDHRRLHGVLRGRPDRPRVHGAGDSAAGRRGAGCGSTTSGLRIPTGPCSGRSPWDSPSRSSAPCSAASGRTSRGAGFWGWDPKENGALLIVLWCAILIHARMGKMIGPFGLAAGSALLIIVVMMAWFGINLLGVGLHSYGFIDGVLLGLLAYSAAQVAAVAALAGWYRHRQRRGSPPPVPPSAGAGAAAAGKANGTVHAPVGRAEGKFHRGGGGCRRTVIRRAALAGTRSAARAAAPPLVPPSRLRYLRG